MSRTAGMFDIAAGPKGTVWYTAKEKDFPCEGGGGTCMLFSQSHPSVIIGRVWLAPGKAVIRVTGSRANRRRARLVVACIDGNAVTGCQGSMRLAIPFGPTVARRPFRVGADRTRTITIRIDRRARRLMRVRGNHRVIAVTETHGGVIAKRPLTIVPG